jgi:hypothetical protein
VPSATAAAWRVRATSDMGRGSLEPLDSTWAACTKRCTGTYCAVLRVILRLSGGAQTGMPAHSPLLSHSPTATCKLWQTRNLSRAFDEPLNCSQCMPVQCMQMCEASRAMRGRALHAALQGGDQSVYVTTYARPAGMQFAHLYIRLMTQAECSMLLVV